MQVGELPTCQKLEVEIETATRFIFCRSMLHIPDSKVFMKLLCPSIFQRLAIEPKDSPFLAVQVYGPQKPTVAESFRAWAGLRSAAFRRRGDASFIQEHQMICYADEEIGVLEISKTGNVIIQDRDVSLGPPCTMIEGGYALATSLQDKRIRNLKQDLRDLEPASEPSDREKCGSELLSVRLQADWWVRLTSGEYNSRTFQHLRPELQRDLFNQFEEEALTARWSLNHTVPVEHCWTAYVKAPESLSRRPECLTIESGRVVTWFEHLVFNSERANGSQLNFGLGCKSPKRLVTIPMGLKPGNSPLTSYWVDRLLGDTLISPELIFFESDAAQIQSHREVSLSGLAVTLKVKLEDNECRSMSYLPVWLLTSGARSSSSHQLGQMHGQWPHTSLDCL
ncbi:unnamed protein product [Symbiodinium sp. KB8]|nr:unnamed protein product [Symbiodinium sp. KB8]